MTASRRIHERFRYDMPVSVLLASDEEHGRSRDISLGGMFITGDFTVPFGAEVRIRLELPAMKEVSEIPATVRWAQPGGLGVQFVSLRAREVWALNQLFRTAEVIQEPADR